MDKLELYANQIKKLNQMIMSKPYEVERDNRLKDIKRKIINKRDSIHLSQHLHLKSIGFYDNFVGT